MDFNFWLTLLCVCLSVAFLATVIWDLGKQQRQVMASVGVCAIVLLWVHVLKPNQEQTFDQQAKRFAVDENNITIGVAGEVKTELASLKDKTDELIGRTKGLQDSQGLNLSVLNQKIDQLQSWITSTIVTRSANAGTPVLGPAPAPDTEEIPPSLEGATKSHPGF